ncbi:hypothetical protein BDK51DRAFT_11189, partial [Blyttiomyces helicus]
FRDIVISLGSTYGLYLLSSILHLDPWHCFTSMFQYLLLLPTYINIFMIYAFCNLHDVSWGTKGDNAAAPLAAVVTKGGDGKQIAHVEVAEEDEDIEARYADFLAALAQQKADKEKPEEEKKPDKETAMQDYYKEFRTRVVLTWMMSNAVLIIVFTNNSIVDKLFNHSVASSVNPFLTFLFWSVAILAAIRFLASTCYLIGWWGTKISEAGGGNR